MKKNKINKIKYISASEIVISIMTIGIALAFLFSSINSYISEKDEREKKSIKMIENKYIKLLKNELSDVKKFDRTKEGNNQPVKITDELTGNGYYKITNHVTDIESEIIENRPTAVIKRIDFEITGNNSSKSGIKNSILIYRP